MRARYLAHVGAGGDRVPRRGAGAKLDLEKYMDRALAMPEVESHFVEGPTEIDWRDQGGGSILSSSLIQSLSEG